MTTGNEIQERISKLQPIYDEILQKYKRWKDLQTLDFAIKEYKELTDREEKKLYALRQRKKELQEEHHRLTLAIEYNPESFEPSIEIVRMEHQKSPVRTLHNQTFPLPIVVDRSMTAVRKRLQKFAHRVRLNNTILSQINRIADDIERPIGEALILLDWNIFINRAAHESMEVYLVRLIDWSEALQEYRPRLAADIDNLEVRFRRWLHVWELWHTRDQTHQDKVNWATFISESCRAMQEESNLLEQELVQLADEISKLKNHLQHTEESI